MTRSNLKDSIYIKIITKGNFPFGGASANYLRNLSLSLSNVGSNVEVLLPSGYSFENEIEAKHILKEGFFNSVKYKYLAFSHHPKNPFAKLFSLVLGKINLVIYLLEQRLKKRLDFVVVYNTSFTDTLFYLILRNFFKFKYVILIPEFYSKPTTKLFTIANLKYYNFYFGIKHLASKADAYIVLSTFLKAYVEKKTKGGKPIIIIPNIIDPEIFANIDTKEFRPGFITIGYTGTPTRKDGIDDLLKSFSILLKEFKNIHLLIIGDNPNGQSLIPNLIKVSKIYNLTDNITFTGLVSYQKIPALLNSCQILALTRPNGIFAEAGFPTKLGEYLACKKPVLVTRVGDIKLYFKDQVHLFLAEPEDIESMVAGFRKIILNSANNELVCQNGYNWMIKNISYKCLSSDLFSFLKKI